MLNMDKYRVVVVTRTKNRPILLQRCILSIISHEKRNQRISDTDSLVRHDAAQKMGDWPPEVDLQEWASNHLKLLWSISMVVSVEEKSRHVPWQV